MAAGDKIRQKLDSLILGPIKSKQSEIKDLIESIRQGGGQSADITKAQDLMTKLDDLESKGNQINAIKSQVQSILNAAQTNGCNWIALPSIRIGSKH